MLKSASIDLIVLFCISHKKYCKFYLCFVGSQVGKKGKECNLSDNCSVLCTCAETTLEKLCDKIKSGKITLDELRRVKNKRDCFYELCIANNSPDNMKLILQQKFDEYDEFYRQLDYIGQICDKVTINVKGRKVKP